MSASTNHWFSNSFSPKIAGWITANANSVKCRMGDLACQDMAVAWGRAIKQKFPEASVVICGGMYYPGGDTDLAEGHSWLEVNGSIFDPTAAQFDSFPDIDNSEYFETEEQVEVEPSRPAGPDQIVDALLEDGVNPKEYAQQLPPDPEVYGDLKPGMVLYDETGAYSRVEEIVNGYGNSYQDVNGEVVYDSRRTRIVRLSEFSPAYAYGRFVQKEMYHAKAGLLGTEVVQVKDNSDEALWALVDAEIDERQGPGTAARDREAHLERERQPEAQERARARAEIQRMMGGNR
jgi:hypothetical protein